MYHIIISFLTALILPLFFYLFYYLKEKEENKISCDAEFKVMASKSIRIFFFDLDDYMYIAYFWINHIYFIC